MRTAMQVPVRVIVAPCRSATTALLQLFAQHPDVHCVYQPVKTGLRATGVPDYRIYHGTHPVFEDHPAFVVSKETLGHSTSNECVFHPLENDVVMQQVRPLFVFRHPMRTWNSWKRFGWGRLELFVATYKYQYDLMDYARAITSYATVVTTESLSQYKGEVLPQICAGWGLPFVDDLLGEFKKPVFDTSRFYMAHIAKQYSQTQGSHETLSQSTTFVLPAAQNDVTTAEEQRVIQGVLEPLYARVCEIEAVDLFTGGLLDNAAQVTV